MTTIRWDGRLEAGSQESKARRKPSPKVQRGKPEGRREESGELAGQGSFVLPFGEGELERRIDGLDGRLLGGARWASAGERQAPAPSWPR